MKQMNESPTKLVTMLPENENQGTSLSKLIEAITDTLIEAGPAVRQLEDQSKQKQEQVLQSLQNLETDLAQQTECLIQVNRQTTGVEQVLSTITRELTKHAECNSRLLQRLEAVEFNMGQVRLLTETIAQKQQQLVDDFIERHVTDHLFKEFLNIQYALGRYSANGNLNLKADIQATAEAIEAFLIESGLNIINPDPGDAFNPHEHKPIKVHPTAYSEKGETIVQTITPGLSRKQRIIQQAHVAVFKAEVKNSKRQQQ